jgi:hypothetical protein
VELLLCCARSCHRPRVLLDSHGAAVATMGIEQAVAAGQLCPPLSSTFQIHIMALASCHVHATGAAAAAAVQGLCDFEVTYFDTRSLNENM